VSARLSAGYLGREFGDRVGRGAFGGFVFPQRLGLGQILVLTATPQMLHPVARLKLIKRLLPTALCR
jgi:hypothetical protein